MKIINTLLLFILLCSLNMFAPITFTDKTHLEIVNMSDQELNEQLFDPIESINPTNVYSYLQQLETMLHGIEEI